MRLTVRAGLAWGSVILCLFLSLFTIYHTWIYHPRWFSVDAGYIFPHGDRNSSSETGVERPEYGKVDEGEADRESDHGREKLNETLDADPEKAIVMARLSSENTTWIEELSEYVHSLNFYLAEAPGLIKSESTSSCGT